MIKTCIGDKIAKHNVNRRLSVCPSTLPIYTGPPPPSQFFADPKI